VQQLLRRGAGRRPRQPAGQLTDRRAKPAVPFAGKFKIIDFPLSNCVNSGIRRIGVLTQYKSQSLIRHIERGWGFLEATWASTSTSCRRSSRGERWYSGTANAVFQNLDLLREAAPRYVLVLAGDHVYKMDYSVMLAEHVGAAPSVSVACIEVPLAEAGDFGVMARRRRGASSPSTKSPCARAALPGDPARALASMGIYVFDAELLFERAGARRRRPRTPATTSATT
jgi:glucose-1-phosphate adenylyltransferase